MYPIQFAVYLGKETETGFCGFIINDGLFLILEVEDGFSPEEGRKLLMKIKEDFKSDIIHSLVDFDTFISQNIQSNNLPTSYSLAAGFQKKDILYLKTTNEGLIYLKRKNQFAEIIQNTNTASGYIQKNDSFILSTNRFITRFGGKERLKNIIQDKEPKQIVNDILPELKGANDEGIIALFLHVKEKESIVSYYEESKPLQEEQEELFVSKKKPWDILFEKSDNKRIITFIAVIVIVIILTWSVVIGNQRRNNELIQTRLNKSKELIEQKLNQAQDVAFLNMPHALVLIGESKKEIQKLKKEMGMEKNKDIQQLELLVQTKEGEITKKEEKKAEEFFDLAVDEKDAQGTKLYLFNDTIAILNSNKGIIYVLSLNKKSLDKKSSSQIKKTTLIAFEQENCFLFVENQGVFKIGTDGKTIKIIDTDKDWGITKDMAVYNGNIYLLDSGKDEIYKYMAGEKTYSQKTSYFKKDQSINLKDSKNFSIDGSVYIGFEDYGLKYTTGVKDEFKTSFSEGNIFIEKLFTSKELEKIYGWDKKKGAVYILSKNGTYERQINSPLLKTASDMIVYEKGIYIIVKSKIYKISE